MFASNVKTINSIIDLSAKKIDTINQHLSANRLEIFSLAQLNFIKNIDDLDVLGMSKQCVGIRGYFYQKSTSDFYLNVDGLDYDSLMDGFMDGLNIDDYSPADLEELKSNQKEIHKDQMVHHALILQSSGPKLNLPLLYLNRNFEPLYQTDYFG